MPLAAALPARMKAITYTEHGSPDVLKLTDKDVPVPKDDQVLIKVRAVGLNPLDWHVMRGEPSFMKMMAKQFKGIPGVDVSGQVVKTGATVTQFGPGDEVFGSARGSCAEYVCTGEKSVIRKPARLTHEQAATIPVPAYTALQALRDRARVQPGQRVLINGAAGGVGTFAVQIARALGAEVTGVCSTRNLEFVRSLGAHHVIDYTADDFAQMGGKWDVILQVAGNRTERELRRALSPRGIAVEIGGGTGRDDSAQIRLLEVMGAVVRGLVFAPFMRQKVGIFMAKGRRSDLQYATELIEAGKLTPVIDRTYPLADTADAIRYLETGHVRGKVVVTV